MWLLLLLLLVGSALAMDVQVDGDGSAHPVVVATLRVGTPSTADAALHHVVVDALDDHAAGAAVQWRLARELQRWSPAEALGALMLHATARVNEVPYLRDLQAPWDVALAVDLGSAALEVDAAAPLPVQVVGHVVAAVPSAVQLAFNGTHVVTHGLVTYRGRHLFGRFHVDAVRAVDVYLTGRPRVAIAPATAVTVHSLTGCVAVASAAPLPWAEVYAVASGRSGTWHSHPLRLPAGTAVRHTFASAATGGLVRVELLAGGNCLLECVPASCAGPLVEVALRAAQDGPCEAQVREEQLGPASVVHPLRDGCFDYHFPGALAGSLQSVDVQLHALVDRSLAAAPFTVSVLLSGRPVLCAHFALALPRGAALKLLDPHWWTLPDTAAAQHSDERVITLRERRMCSDDADRLPIVWRTPHVSVREEVTFVNACPCVPTTDQSAYFALPIPTQPTPVPLPRDFEVPSEKPVDPQSFMA